MNTSMSMRISTRILMTTNILTRTRNTAMSILIPMIMNIRIRTAMNMITRGKPMRTIMSIRVNTEHMIINILDMKKNCTSIKIQRKNS
ncbi:MAG: hypothetical protein AB1638_06320 [Nitrospirota bacterium]